MIEILKREDIQVSPFLITSNRLGSGHHNAHSNVGKMRGVMSSTWETCYLRKTDCLDSQRGKVRKIPMK
jgi:hypothetical protein